MTVDPISPLCRPISLAAGAATTCGYQRGPRKQVSASTPSRRFDRLGSLRKNNSASVAAALADVVATFDAEQVDREIAAAIARIDVVVGSALDLSAEEISFVQEEMSTDPFLARAEPRLPFFRARQYGRRLNLERRDRYG